MTWNEPEECQLCGNNDRRALRWGLVVWADAEPGMAYEHIGRCRDEAPCRARVQADGDRWPLKERSAV